MPHWKHKGLGCHQAQGTETPPKVPGTVTLQEPRPQGPRSMAHNHREGLLSSGHRARGDR